MVFGKTLNINRQYQEYSIQRSIKLFLIRNFNYKNYGTIKKTTYTYIAIWKLNEGPIDANYLLTG